MHSPHATARGLPRITHLLQLVLLPALLITFNSCTHWRKEHAYKNLNHTVLENEYMRVMQYENQVTPADVRAALRPGGKAKPDPKHPGEIILGGKPFWTAPQFLWIRSIDTAPISASQRRALRIQCIKKYGIAYAVFKPDPADRQFLRIGESDDDGFTLRDLHKIFGPKLPPMSTLLQLSLHQPPAVTQASQPPQSPARKTYH